MNCSKCGFQINDGANFCPKCGSRDMQNNLLHHEKDSISDTTTTSKESDERKTKSGRSLLIAILLIVIVFSVGYGSYHFSVLKYTAASPEKSSKTPLISNDAAKDNASLSKNEDNPVSADKTDINEINSPKYHFFPKSESEKLIDSDVSGLSKENLALARNEIFARHGYVFKYDPFESYFNNKSWYKPDPSFKGLGEGFSAIESYNIQLILKFENK